MRRYRIIRPAKSLCRRSVTLDNMALVPASLLAHKERWQRLLNELPSGSVLIVTPLSERSQRYPFDQVAAQLCARGRRVWTMRAAQVLDAPKRLIALP